MSLLDAEWKPLRPTNILILISSKSDAVHLVITLPFKLHLQIVVSEVTGPDFRLNCIWKKEKKQSAYLL